MFLDIIFGLSTLFPPPWFACTPYTATYSYALGVSLGLERGLSFPFMYIYSLSARWGVDRNIALVSELLQKYTQNKQRGESSDANYITKIPKTSPNTPLLPIAVDA